MEEMTKHDASCTLRNFWMKYCPVCGFKLMDGEKKPRGMSDKFLRRWKAQRRRVIIDGDEVWILK